MAASNIHDYSTGSGRANLILNRIYQNKWTISISALTLCCFLFLMLHAEYGTTPASNPQDLLAPLPITNPLETFEHSSPTSTLPLEPFSDFEGIIGKSSLKSLILQNVSLDAPSLSQSLQNHPELEEIFLINVWLVGNFSPVLLPNLSTFIYQQHGEDSRDSYKSPGTLKSTLFFEKYPKRTLSVEKDLMALGMEIKLLKGGTKLIEINERKGKLYLNVRYCQKILGSGSHLSWVRSLTLIKCNLTQSLISAFPPTLQYVNFRNAIPSTHFLQGFLKRQKILEAFYAYFDFHCDWPGSEIVLELSGLPGTVRKLGVDNMELSAVPGYTSPLKEFSVGDFLNEDIATRLKEIFKNAQILRFINISAPLLRTEELVQMNVGKASFVMYKKSLRNDESGTGDEVNQLKKLGLDEDATDFTILGNGTGMLLSEDERNLERYIGLGFDEMDSWNDYLKWDKL